MSKEIIGRLERFETEFGHQLDTEMVRRASERNPEFMEHAVRSIGIDAAGIREIVDEGPSDEVYSLILSIGNQVRLIRLSLLLTDWSEVYERHKELVEAYLLESR